jgi:DNA-binding CsgD family transcriptional regulator
MREYERLLDIIDLMYQAAIEPDLWPRVFDGMAALLSAERAVLLARPGGKGMAIPSLRLDPAAAAAYLETYEAINPIQQQLDRRRIEAPMVFTDQTFIPKRDLQHSQFFTDFMRPTKMHAFLLARMSAPHTAALNVIRDTQDGDFDAREMHLAMVLQRPLSRAYNMGLRLAAERRTSEGLTDYVERLTSAVFLVGADAAVAFASPAAQALLADGDGLRSSGRTLRASAPEAQRRLARLIGQAVSTDSESRRGGAITLPRPSGRRPLAALVTPARGGGSLIAPGGPYALVSVVDPEASETAPVDRLRELFGFTPAEARVAALFIGGLEPKAIGEQLGLSVHTVRVQITRIRAKTDTSRQGEFIALVTRSLGGRGWPLEP